MNTDEISRDFIRLSQVLSSEKPDSGTIAYHIAAILEKCDDETYWKTARSNLQSLAHQHPIITDILTDFTNEADPEYASVQGHAHEILEDIRNASPQSGL